MSGWPLSEGQDAALLGQFCAKFAGHVPARVGVAVSGGGDSMALLHMALRARPHLGWQVSAVTVDHGLRSESAAEARGVTAYCADLGISHSILTWQGPAPTGNLMEQARDARASLIAEWTKRGDVSHVLLGHTADDNAESFLMNLAREAGIDGLSGMRPLWQGNGIAWHRPLLEMSRQCLRAYLVRNEVAWTDDPSNDNLRFARIRARRAMSALAPLGITAETLSHTLSNLSDARQALTGATARIAAEMSVEAGALRLNAEAFRRLDREIARRLLASAIQWMNGAGYPPRGNQVFHLWKKLFAGEDAQLGGARFRLRNDCVHVTREPRAVEAAVPFGQVWDHRWVVTGPALADGVISALGAQGLRQCPDWRAHGPREALIVTPAVWQEDRLISAPLAGRPDAWRAEMPISLNKFILSH